MKELVTGYLVGEELNSFKKIVIEKVKNKREENFIKAFLEAYPEEMESGLESTKLDTLFQKISSSPSASEMLFEVYRKVCLSASNDLAPKILGMLTAKICSEERLANQTEGLIFESLQELNDLEIREIYKYFDSIDWIKDSNHGRVPYIHINEFMSGKIQKVDTHRGIFKSKKYYEVGIDGHTIHGKSNYEEIISKPSLTKTMGRWAVKLKNLEILIEETNERSDYRPDDDFQGQTERTFNAKIDKEYIDILLPLIKRAPGPKLQGMSSVDGG